MSIRGRFRDYVVDDVIELDDLPEIEGSRCVVINGGPLYYTFLNSQWTLKSDAQEYADLASLPVTGESNKVYITTDSNNTYRWNGIAYVAIGASGSLALGETNTTAYRGDRGKTAFDHSQSAHETPGAAAAAETAANNYTDTEISSLSSAVSSALSGKMDNPTGTPDGTKYLRDDNTWQPISGGSGLTQSEVLTRLSFRI